ncbi:MAG: peptidylprolyl isomerase [Gammaproteobacteria bacterium]|nr:peptidylprolyl isomerase [Gammaproteobacteria bacterium]MBJ55137.1 peptidylprolyl isomerase [Gammaproteobacteria bacterium]HBN14547.1 peptidylprolyl isomerase [Pseudohongiella sp.]|tara:strand:+ start:3652 stop:4521 length:870 start_codon:yes stop_codon:yes gene_type:complete
MTAILRTNQINLRRLCALTALCVLAASFSSMVPAQSFNEPTLNNPRNPVLEINSSLGDIQLELFPDAAPQNVERVRQLAAPERAYYDNLTFHRSVNNTLIQLGAPERAGRERPATTVPDEINARGLGLEQQQVLDPGGRPHAWLNIRDQMDFQSKLLMPLYRRLNISNESQLIQRQDEVLGQLRNMNLLQAYEQMGYRYDGTLASRRPLAGSVVMANYGPNTNDGELVILLRDAPWLTGTHTVVGRVASGMDVVEQIGRYPNASVRVYQVRPVSVTPAEDTINNGQTTP